MVYLANGGLRLGILSGQVHAHVDQMYFIHIPSTETRHMYIYGTQLEALSNIIWAVLVYTA